jgi:putative oxidoreductase
MLHQVLSAKDDWTGVVLRVMLGFVVSAHGAQKLLGWFGGYGFEGTMQFFTGTVGLPWLVGFSVILLESLGALLLIAGLGSRLLAGAMTLLFVGIIFTTHAQNGFFMNWFGNQPGEGMEFSLLAIGLSVGIVFNGSGRYSLDRLLTNRKGVRVTA